ncbi:MAG: ribosome maturation factor RimM [Pseudomonadota bacterium]
MLTDPVNDPGLEMVVLGKIVGPYGVQGAVRIHPFADDPLSWAKLPQWWLSKEGTAESTLPEHWRASKLISCKAHNDSLIARLECVPDRASSENLHGILIGVPRHALPATAKNEYYWADLIGLDVFNKDNELLGQVLGLIATPANDVLRVLPAQIDKKTSTAQEKLAAERLLPFVNSVVLDVDLQAGRIKVDWGIDW